MPRNPRIPAAAPALSKREPKPVSLKVLSDHLGLSIAAISRVLSASPAARSIPKETQNRIQAAAETLNYRPNLFARSLRNRRSQTIGVLVPEVSEGYTTLVLSGIEHLLLQADYFYFLVSNHHRDEMIQRSQRLFQDRAVEGIIAVDTLLRERWAIPTVTVSGHREPKGVTNIVLNHRLAAALAIDHLADSDIAGWPSSRGRGSARIRNRAGAGFVT
jgi:DNA-binding LacI/PurR family transcriptional regulator